MAGTISLWNDGDLNRGRGGALLHRSRSGLDERLCDPIFTRLHIRDPNPEGSAAREADGVEADLLLGRESLDDSRVLVTPSAPVVQDDPFPIVECLERSKTGFSGRPPREALRSRQ